MAKHDESNHREQKLFSESLCTARSNQRDADGTFQYPPVPGSFFFVGRNGPIEIASAASWCAARDQRSAELRALDRARAIWPTSEGWVIYRVAVVEICAVRVEDC